MLANGIPHIAARQTRGQEIAGAVAAIPVRETPLRRYKIETANLGRMHESCGDGCCGISGFPSL